MTKKILDVTCGSRSIWFNKNHPAALYCDVRDEECTGVWKSAGAQVELAYCRYIGKPVVELEEDRA